MQEIAAHLFIAHFALQGDAAASGATVGVDKTMNAAAVSAQPASQTVEAACYLRVIFGVDGHRPERAQACSDHHMTSASAHGNAAFGFGSGAGAVEKDKCVDP